MQIKIENLSYEYTPSRKGTGYKALNNLTFEIDEGEFFGIIGHTGSGKSTFVQHLNGLIKIAPKCGKITIGDFDLTDKNCDFKKLRSKVGMVFQYPEYQLFAETVFSDVAFGLKNFYPNLSNIETEDRVREALQLVGLNYFEVKDKSPFELSGGQKRRVAIAGVIVSRPEILVLDEPAAGLDPVGKREFIALLHSLKNNFVKTIIIVSHDMNLVAENCTKVAVFSKGEVVKLGVPKDIFTDREELESFGLELPVTASLTEKLKRNGIKINSDLTKEDFIEKAFEYFKGGNV